jgi:anti-sigma B factor antagonist
MDDATAEPLREALRPPGPVKLGLDASRVGGVITVVVEGELDLLTAPKLSARIAELLRERAADVLVDLGPTAFIDSAGLAILLNVQRRVERSGKRLRVVCDEGPVRRVIELARLEETFGLVPSLTS